MCTLRVWVMLAHRDTRLPSQITLAQCPSYPTTRFTEVISTAMSSSANSSSRAESFGFFWKQEEKGKNNLSGQMPTNQFCSENEIGQKTGCLYIFFILLLLLQPCSLLQMSCDHGHSCFFKLLLQLLVLDPYTFTLHSIYHGSHIE